MFPNHHPPTSSSPSKHLSELLLFISFTTPQLYHELDKLIELDEACALHVQLVDHVVDLAVRGVLSKTPQHRDQLLQLSGWCHSRMTWRPLALWSMLPLSALSNSRKASPAKEKLSANSEQEEEVDARCEGLWTLSRLRSCLAGDICPSSLPDPPALRLSLSSVSMFLPKYQSQTFRRLISFWQYSSLYSSTGIPHHISSSCLQWTSQLEHEHLFDFRINWLLSIVYWGWTVEECDGRHCVKCL